MVLAQSHSLASHGQEKGGNHSADKLSAMIECQSAKQKGDAIHRSFREKRRLEATHRHGHGHSLTKIHLIIVVVTYIPTHGHYDHKYKRTTGSILLLDLREAYVDA